MSEFITDPVELYRARGLPEAHALRLALEQEGIAVRIDNELLQGAIGELPMGWTTAPRVMIDRTDGPKALALLEGFHMREAESRAEEEGQDLDDGVGEDAAHCLACNASMREEEDSCSACGWTFGPLAGEAEQNDEEPDL